MSERILVSAAVVLRGDQVLLTRRMRGSHLEGYWEFPGGKLESGESPEEAVVRECHEECGIDVEVDDIFEVIQHSYPEKTVLLFFYTCRLAPGSGEVQHLGVSDHVWCELDGLSAYPLPPADQRLIDKLQARARQSPA